ncbi:MAG TPA: ectonucleotide pyrophosphatase/phosphodiesterase [Puia sp.]|nr:ectonucleotide pyrophosphatase/phosphodiesterase [Puia sp.]
MSLSRAHHHQSSRIDHLRSCRSHRNQSSWSHRNQSSRRHHLLFFLFAFTATPALAQYNGTEPGRAQQIVPGRTNGKEQQQKPYLIMISGDGFRYDLADKYKAVHLLELRSNGVAATSMQPGYPSLTFPNHYALATGMYPSHHGLVNNTFYDAGKGKMYRINDRRAVADSSWYGGTPVWTLAEQQHMLTASFFWVGSEAAIQGVRPTYYYRFNDSIELDTRIQAVKNWLQLPPETRPHLITFYLSQVDHAEHMNGVDSKKTEEAVHIVDDCIGKMVSELESLHLPISYIFVSDHGMATEDTLHTLSLPPAVDTTKFIVADGEALLELYAKDKKDVPAAYKALKAQADGFDVYLPDETPAGWHYRSADDRYNRIGDILLVSKFPRGWNIRHRKPIPGMHGFDNSIPEMQATFYAWGPAFRQHLQIGAFSNVDVYPLIAKVLGLSITEKIDGSPDTLKDILR